nr:hypothetical protein [Lachnospiraceae bacterium]
MRIKRSLLLMVLIMMCALSGCKNKNGKDKFVGIWITWEDSMQFRADSFVSNRYLSNGYNVDCSASDSGLYIFNYIEYADGKIKDRVTIASDELEVTQTEYKDDKIYNTATLTRSSSFPDKLYFYKIKEKADGTVYVEENSKEAYSSQKGVEQTKKFNNDSYNIELTFTDKNTLTSMEVIETNESGEVVRSQTLNNYELPSEYTLEEGASYVTINEKYEDSNGSEVNDSKYLVFNSNVSENIYDCTVSQNGLCYNM